MEKIITEMSNESVGWKYIVPKASWEAGVYERLVRPVKQALLRTFHGRSLCEQQLLTILLEMEATLNSRPLTYVGTDDEPQPLTPNDFLRVQYTVNETPDAASTSSAPRQTILAISRQAQELLNTFWNIWKTQYLSTLRECHIYDNNTRTFKQVTSQVRPKIGDVVLVSEPNQRRAVWKLARVTQLNESGDQQIRSATVRLANGHTLSRPLQDLYSLEVTDSVASSELQPETASTQPEEDDDSIVEIECEIIESADE